MIREYIEDELGIWNELQRLDAPCGVCGCVTPHADYQHKAERDEGNFARMCLNHCDIKLDEVIAEVEFRHTPTKKYVHAYIEKHHWGNMHGRGESSEFWYSIRFNYYNGKGRKGMQAGSSGPLNPLFYPDEYDAIPLDNLRALNVWLTERAIENVAQQYANLMPKLDSEQLMLL